MLALTRIILVKTGIQEVEKLQPYGVGVVSVKTPRIVLPWTTVNPTMYSSSSTAPRAYLQL